MVFRIEIYFSWDLSEREWVVWNEGFAEGPPLCFSIAGILHSWAFLRLTVGSLSLSLTSLANSVPLLSFSLAAFLLFYVPSHVQSQLVVSRIQISAAPLRLLSGLYHSRWQGFTVVLLALWLRVQLGFRRLLSRKGYRSVGCPSLSPCLSFLFKYIRPDSGASMFRIRLAFDRTSLLLWNSPVNVLLSA